MTQNRFDLHMHSNRSDGTDEPALVVEKAADAGLRLMALTDHDTVAGVEEAVKAGAACGIGVLPAIEMDSEWPSEMHILGLGVDVEAPALTAALKTAQQRRIARNRVIFEKLAAAGYDVVPYLETRAEGSVTRLHIALALMRGGYADSIKTAFDRYLRRGCVGHYTVPRFTPAEVVSLIRSAGGTPVWAHPYHGGGNVEKALDMLLEAGLMGLEAYHLSASNGQSNILVNLARRNGLIVTCGSDFHGAHRQEAVPGCTWRDTEELRETYRYLTERYLRKTDGGAFD